MQCTCAKVEKHERCVRRQKRKYDLEWGRLRVEEGPWSASAIFDAIVIIVSKIQLVVYYQCCVLIG